MSLASSFASLSLALFVFGSFFVVSLPLTFLLICATAPSRDSARAFFAASPLTFPLAEVFVPAMSSVRPRNQSRAEH